MILEVSEQRLIAGGPEAIRLQDIAADAGISHPAILHHFHSREGLMEALGAHAARRLQENLLRIFQGGEEGTLWLSRVERAYRTLELGYQELEERGYARVLASLILSGREMQTRVAGVFSKAAEVLYAVRVQKRRQEGRPIPELEETLFGMTLMIILLFGDALCGPIARAMVGLPDDAATRQRFRLWLARYMAMTPPAPYEARENGQSAKRTGTKAEIRIHILTESSP